jgi:hypothetical protein
MKALSVRQPWASLIMLGIKPVENREWSTLYRGPLLIHASRRHDHGANVSLAPDQLVYGAVFGIVDLIDIVTEHPSPFFTGPYGWVLVNPRRIEPIPMPGRLRLFDVDLPDDLDVMRGRA